MKIDESFVLKNKEQLNEHFKSSSKNAFLIFMKSDCKFCKYLENIIPKVFTVAEKNFKVEFSFKIYYC